MSQELALYNAISRDPQSAMQFIDTMGVAFFKGGMCGVKSEGQGKMIALTCLAEGMTPTQFNKKYHILGDGKLQHQATWMAAEMERRGWKLTWVRDGDDGQAAELLCEKSGVKQPVMYSIEHAQKAGLVKDKSGWDKNPGEMLRARARTKAAVMLEPSIVSGHDESFDIEPMGVPVEPVSVSPTPATEDPIDADYTIEDPHQAMQAEATVDNASAPLSTKIVQEIRDLVAKHQINLYVTELLSDRYDAQSIRNLDNNQARHLLIRVYADLCGVKDKLPAAIAKYNAQEVEQLALHDADQVLAFLRPLEAKLPAK